MGSSSSYEFAVTLPDLSQFLKIRDQSSTQEESLVLNPENTLCREM